MVNHFVEYIKSYRLFIFVVLFIAFFYGKSYYEGYVDPDNYLETPITQDNINNIVAIALEKTPNLNEQKVDLLKTLRTINLGYSAHLDYLTRENKNGRAEALVNQPNFNYVSAQLFDFIDKNNFKLKQFFYYIDQYPTLKSNFDKKNNAFYKEVDRYNFSFQEQLDKLPAIERQKRSKLNELFDVKFDNIETDYAESGIAGTGYLFATYELKFKGVNKLPDPIRSFNYTLIFKSKKGKYISTYRTGYTNTYIKDEYTITNKFNRGYESLQDYGNMSELEISISKLKSQNNKIYYSIATGLLQDIEVQVTDISTTEHHYPNMEEYALYNGYRDQNYETPEKLNGEGPYSNKEMRQIKTQLEDEWNQLQLDKFGQLYRYKAYLSEFYYYFD